MFHDHNFHKQVHYKMHLDMKPKALIETDQNITAKKPNKSQNPVK